jgi:hypothetical protein
MRTRADVQRPLSNHTVAYEDNVLVLPRGAAGVHGRVQRRAMHEPEVSRVNGTPVPVQESTRGRQKGVARGRRGAWAAMQAHGSGYTGNEIDIR